MLISHRQVSKKGLPGTHDKCMFKFVRSCQSVFQCALPQPATLPAPGGCASPSLQPCLHLVGAPPPSLQPAPGGGRSQPSHALLSFGASPNDVQICASGIFNSPGWAFLSCGSVRSGYSEGSLEFCGSLSMWLLVGLISTMGEAVFLSLWKVLCCFLLFSHLVSFPT